MWVGDPGCASRLPGFAKWKLWQPHRQTGKPEAEAAVSRKPVCGRRPEIQWGSLETGSPRTGRVRKQEEGQKDEVGSQGSHSVSLSGPGSHELSSEGDRLPRD